MRCPIFVSLVCLSILSISASGAEPLAAKAKTSRMSYTGRELTLDGSGSATGRDIQYQWTVAGENAQGAKIDDADKVVAHMTPSMYGAYKFTLTVTQGTASARAVAQTLILQAPEAPYPDYPGMTKIAYKTARDALGGQHAMPLYVAYPAGWQASDRRAAILLFHGGGWGRGDATRYLAECKYYASRGMVAMTVEYRVGLREGATPADCVADAKSAVRYVRGHAAALGIDPQKIAAGGESAGAHIAACTGTVPEYNDPADDRSISCVPDALLLYFPYQMVTNRGNKKDDMSPLDFVGPATPPTLFIAGEMDRIAPAERGIQWGQKAAAANRPFRFFIYKRTHHPSGTHDIMKPGVDNDMVRQTDLFLASLGLIDGAPTIPPLTADWTPDRLYVNPRDFHPPPDQDPKNPK